MARISNRMEKKAIFQLCSTLQLFRPARIGIAVIIFILLTLSLPSYSQHVEFMSYINDTHIGRCLAISSDGRHVYAGGPYSLAVFERRSDGSLSTVQVLNNGYQGVENLLHVFAMAVSPDGRHVYAIRSLDQSMLLFARDTSTGMITLQDIIRDNAFAQPFGVQTISPERNYSLLISPDGNSLYWLYCLNWDFPGNLLAVFARDHESGGLTKVQTLMNGMNALGGLKVPSSIAISPDGKNLYGAGYNKRLLLMLARDYSSGLLSFENDYETAPNPTPFHSSWLQSTIEVSADGRFIYAASFDASRFVVFERNSDNGTLEFLSEMSQSGTLGILTSSDNRNVYLGGNGFETYRHDLQTGELILVQETTEVGSTSPSGLIIAPDGATIYATGDPYNNSGTLTSVSRNPNTGELTILQELDHNIGGTDRLLGSTGTEISPDGRFLYVAAGRPDNAISVFSRNQDTGDLSLSFVDSLFGTTAMVMSPDGRYLCVAIKDYNVKHSIKILALNQQNGRWRVIQTVAVPYRIFANNVSDENSLVFSPDGFHLYVNGQDRLQVFDRDPHSGLISRGQIIMGRDYELGEMVALTESPDGEHLYWYDTLALANHPRQQRIATFRRDSGTGELIFVSNTLAGSLIGNQQAITASPDGRHVYAGTQADEGDANILQYDRNPVTGELTFNTNFYLDNRSNVKEILFSADGLTVYSGHSGSLEVWDREPASGWLTQRQTFQSFRNGIYASIGPRDLTLSPDESFLYLERFQGLAIFSTGRKVSTCLPLPSTAAYGHLRRGDRTHPDQVAYCFEAASKHAVLQFQAYDIDKPNEVDILLNGTKIGNVPITADEQWSSTISMTLPENLIRENQKNELVFDHTRNPDKQWNWGVRQVAVATCYPLPSQHARGRIKGHDQVHIDRVIYAFDGGTGDFNLSFEAYDVDFHGEAEVVLNGSKIATLDTTADHSWSPTRTLLLPDSLINDSGSNILSFDNQKNPPKIWYWGVRNVEATPVAGGQAYAAGAGESALRKTESLPTEYALSQNYPNPFAFSGGGNGSGNNTETTIRYEIPQTTNGTQHVTLSIYNLQGQLVRTLVDASKAPGSYTSTWDGRDARGEQVPSGVYFYRMTAGDYSMAKRLVVVR